jgi:hypothetical protein
MSRIGHLCEPEPDEMSVLVTNATIEALPEVAGLSDSREKRILIEHGYRVSRALLGDALADRLGEEMRLTV